MMTEDDDFDEGEVQVMEGGEDEGDEEGELSVMSLMGLSVMRSREVRTMKLRGKVQKVPVLLLVDSGATHNFISQNLVKAMGLEVEVTTPLYIKLGDGFMAKTQGECKGVMLEIADLKVKIDAQFLIWMGLILC